MARITQQSTMGVLTTDMPRGPVATWDRQQDVGVKLISGTLSRRETTDVLAGGGLLAIGDGSPDRWEVLQYRDATPLGTREFALSTFLRGQAGTNAMIPDLWPVGSRVIVLDGVQEQLNLAASGQRQHGSDKRALTVTIGTASMYRLAKTPKAISLHRSSLMAAARPRSWQAPTGRAQHQSAVGSTLRRSLPVLAPGPCDPAWLPKCVPSICQTCTTPPARCAICPQTHVHLRQRRPF